MKRPIVLKRFAPTVLFFTFLLSCFSLFAQEKKKRVFRTKETTDSFIAEKFLQVPIDSFILKFTEGTKIRMRGNKFVILDNSIKTKESRLLEDSQIRSEDLPNEVLQLNSILKGFQNLTVKRYFERPEEEVDKEQDALEDKVHEELADLNLYYLIVLRSGDAKLLIRSLNNLKIVENAYPVYKIENATFKGSFIGDGGNELNMSDEFSARQEYLNAAPKGINARYAWTINGGKGNAVRIIDIEDQWDVNHEDLKPPFWRSSFEVISNGTPRGNHGTAVLGEIVAEHNQFGIKGISPDVSYGISGVSGLSTHTRSVSAAIDKASRQLKAGDIILIEQHTPGPRTGEVDNTCNPEQFEYVPMEFYQDCFDAIRRTTAKGIIVVEAAGNGGVNLDAPLYKRLFDRNVRDSKAILVAGDEGGNGVPACWTNYGNRIDFFGWGKNIITSGYGDLVIDQTDNHKKYTASFGGTSGASPIIVGAIACIQGIRKKMALNVWTSELIRSNFLGTSQSVNIKSIGIMPDLKATIEKMMLTQ